MSAEALASAVRLVRPAVPLPGRKKRLTKSQPSVPLSPEAVRQKNRDAQRAHRDRVSRKISDLESEVSRLRLVVKGLEEENGRMKQELSSYRCGSQPASSVSGRDVAAGGNVFVKTDVCDIKTSFSDVESMTPAVSRHSTTSPVVSSGTIANMGCSWSQSTPSTAAITTTTSSMQQQQAVVAHHHQSSPSASLSPAPASLADAANSGFILQQPSTPIAPAPFGNQFAAAAALAMNSKTGYPAGSGSFQILSHGSYPSPSTPTNLSLCSPVMSSPAPITASTTASPMSPFFASNIPVTAALPPMPVDTFRNGYGYGSSISAALEHPIVVPTTTMDTISRLEQHQQMILPTPTNMTSGSCATSLMHSNAASFPHQQPLQFVNGDWRVPSM
ncbi:hypothetical protein HDU97_007079 [Phlyctochytrium planicorne]|nr:hypothetical protein HDU97_007079 [Phlyctochytrium planicorne]